MANEVIVVDEKDTALYVCDKITAHFNCRLHRAFSIFLFNSMGQWLLQKRAGNKYHSGGLWSNTCCGHPQLMQPIERSASLRLQYEMGIVCAIKEVFSFIYKCDCGAGISEYEYDHVFVGKYDGVPNPKPHEVKDWMWATEDQIECLLQGNPQNFTYWFRYLFVKLSSGYDIC